MTSDDDKGSCCTPARSADGDVGAARAVRPRVDGAIAASSRHEIPQARIPAGASLMGDCTGNGNRGDGETPVHVVELDAFEIDATTVTNAQFARFVEDTGYHTEAEVFGFSAVFHLALEKKQPDIVGVPDATPWWAGVSGAYWAAPGGPGSTVEGREDHPVVHISWNDAVAYCDWVGRQLPTEAEWERASRGGLEGKCYPWGDELMHPEAGGWRCNIWQGLFPRTNTAEDGWVTTAPVDAFEPNGFGLWQSVGNVWEWCADWYSPDYYAVSPARDPRGPEYGAVRVLRGGSYLCHDSYCYRYRNSARSSNTPDSSMGNAGFRTVAHA